MSAKTPSVRQYVQKLQDLRPDDPGLDDYLDEVADDADSLKKKERVSAAQVVNLDDTLGDLVKMAQMAQGFAKRGQFDKAQDVVQDIGSLINAMLKLDLFREAAQLKKLKQREGADYPRWAR